MLSEARPILSLALMTIVAATNVPAASESADDSETKPTQLHQQAKPAGGSGPQTLDSTPFNAVLERHLEQGRMDYASLLADTVATARLQAYVEAIAQMPDSEPLSSWINSYNALVIHAVLERYPLASVKDAEGGDFKFFREILYTVAGAERSLDNIENAVIRPRFEDARIHVALNCGALSCPPLAPQAFEEATLDSTLDHLAKVAVNDGHHIYIVDGKLVVNEIFKWFEPDFVRDGGSLLNWIQSYSADAEVKGLAADAVIDVYPYDWALTDVP